MNVPNALTIMRLALVPFFVGLVLTERYQAAFIIFLAASLSDLIDGWIARTFKQSTKFGERLDPVADKLLLSSALIVLTFKGILPLWFCIVVVSRDVIMLSCIFVLTFWLKRLSREADLTPALSGKATTFLQAVAVCYAMLMSGLNAFHPLFLLATTATLTSAVEYSIRGLGELKHAKTHQIPEETR